MDPCPGISGVIKWYKIDYQAIIVNMDVSMCMNGRCSHTFEPPSNPPPSYYSVSVAAENVVGVGAARNCTAQTVSELLLKIIHCVQILLLLHIIFSFSVSGAHCLCFLILGLRNFHKMYFVLLSLFVPSMVYQLLTVFVS